VSFCKSPSAASPLFCRPTHAHSADIDMFLAHVISHVYSGNQIGKEGGRSTGAKSGAQLVPHLSQSQANSAPDGIGLVRVVKENRYADAVHTARS
jgi:hypothetical protein